MDKFNPNQTDIWESYIARTEGGSRSPTPLLSWLWSKFWLKNHVSLKADINFKIFGPFLEIVFKNHKKKSAEIKRAIKKWLNICEIFKFCNFWGISTCNTTKESIFHMKFNFKEKKYDLIEEKFKKSDYFLFFCQNQCWPPPSIAHFSNLCQKILKLSSPVLWKGFEIKIHQRRAHYINPPRYGEWLAARGREPPSV